MFETQYQVKLLAVRSSLHAKLPLSDFAAVLDVSYAFMAATEEGFAGAGKVRISPRPHLGHYVVAIRVRSHDYVPNVGAIRQEL